MTQREKEVFQNIMAYNNNNQNLTQEEIDIIIKIMKEMEEDKK